MTIREIFKTIHKGVRLEKDNKYHEDSYVCLDTININNCVISTSTSDKEKIQMKIKDKHFLHKDDIVIASVPSSKTSHVGYADTIPDYKIIIKKNIIFLRDIIPEYNPLFVAEYLENIAIKNLYKIGKKKEYEVLTLEDIEEIDIPDISIEDQMKYVELFKPIIERTKLYKQLMVNDNTIINYLLEEVIKNGKNV